MKQLLLVASLLLLEATALPGPDMRTASPTYHGKRNFKLQSTGYKLPGTARPKFYDLTITISLNGMTPYLEGVVEITLDVDKQANGSDTYSVQLNTGIHFDNLNISDGVFLWNNAMDCSLSNFGSDFTEISCPEPINGENQILKIIYEPSLGWYDLSGAYLAGYNESLLYKTIVATQFKPGYARRIMPCFDEPEYKAPIKLTLNTDRTNMDFSNWLANTDVVQTVESGTWISTSFAATPNISTYLLGFVATADYVNYTNPDLKADYEFLIFSKSTAGDSLSIALENGPKLIDLMGAFTGIPYVSLGNHKMKFVTVPESSLAAEGSWGLTFFREQIFLDEGSRTPNADLQYIIQVIAHEISHQWFGSYVTLDWWSESWLDEGFAQYFEYYLTQQLYSDFEMDQQFVVKELQQALKTDSQADTIPLSRDASSVNSTEDINKSFGDIAYSKGATVLKMIRYTMGDDAFQKGLQAYLNQNKLSSASSEILIKAFQAALPKGSTIDLSKLFNSWIYNAGYPILHVSLNSSNKVTIKASRFSSSLNKSGEDTTANWWLPLTYTTSSNPDFATINFEWTDPTKIDQFSVSLIDSSSWIIFNIQSTGFYRVNYDSTLWSRITNTLTNEKTFSTINVINRAQLLDDAFNFAKSADGTQEQLTEYYSRAFGLAEYLKYETEYHPWYTFFNEMQFLLERIQDEDTITALKNKILQIVTLQVVIPPASENVTHMEALRSNLLLSWACKVGHEGCIQWAQQQYEAYMEDTSSIDNNYRELIVSTTLEHTNTSGYEYSRLYPILRESASPLEQRDLIKAIAHAHSLVTITKILQTTVNYINPHYPKLYYDTLLTELISLGSEKVGAALSFVLTYDYSIDQYWISVLTPEEALKKVATKIYSQKYINQIQAFIEKWATDTDYESMIVAANEAIEIASQNLAWLEKYGSVLTSVLQ